MAPSVSEVRLLSSTGWEGTYQDSEVQQFIDFAEREVKGLYGGRVSTLSETEGDLDDLIALVAAHKLELAEGGEAQSESATGGSVNYNTVTGEVPNGWSETRYGRQALDYIRQMQSIGMVRTW